MRAVPPPDGGGPGDARDGRTARLEVPRAGRAPVRQGRGELVPARVHGASDAGRVRFLAHGRISKRCDPSQVVGVVVGLVSINMIHKQGEVQVV